MKIYVASLRTTKLTSIYFGPRILLLGRHQGKKFRTSSPRIEYHRSLIRIAKALAVEVIAKQRDELQGEILSEELKVISREEIMVRLFENGHLRH